MGRKEERQRPKPRQRTGLKILAAGLLLSWLCLMAWPTRPGPFAYSWPFFLVLGAGTATAAFSWLRLARDDAAAALRRPAVLVLAACAAALLAAEWTTRLAGLAEWGGGQGPLQPSWRLARYKRNSLGLRGPEFPAPGPAQGETRVLVLGDSFAFGQGVAEGEPFPELLQSKLNAASQGAVRVLNAGLPGWNTVDEHLFFERIGRAYEPKALIVAFTLNDAESAPYVLAPLTGLWEARWLWRSHLYFLLVKARNAAVRPYEKHIRSLYAEDQSGWRDCRTALSLIARRCREAGCRPLLAVFPMLEDFERYPFEDLHAAANAAGREAGFEVVDLLQAFRATGAPAESFRVSAGDRHPNAAGHRLAAEALFKALQAPRA